MAGGLLAGLVHSLMSSEATPAAEEEEEEGGWSDSQSELGGEDEATLAVVLRLISPRSEPSSDSEEG